MTSLHTRDLHNNIWCGQWTYPLFFVMSPDNSDLNINHLFTENQHLHGYNNITLFSSKSLKFESHWRRDSFPTKTLHCKEPIVLIMQLSMFSPSVCVCVGGGGEREGGLVAGIPWALDCQNSTCPREFDLY